MKRIHSLNDSLLAGQLRNLLESHGIDCELRNLNLRTAMGEVPLAECWIELWIGDESAQERAMALIRGHADAGSERAPWSCADCGESHDGQFDACWKCGATAPAA